MAGGDRRNRLTENLRTAHLNFTQDHAQVVAQLAYFLITLFRILRESSIQNCLQLCRCTAGTRFA